MELYKDDELIHVFEVEPSCGELKEVLDHEVSEATQLAERLYCTHEVVTTTCIWKLK